MVSRNISVFIFLVVALTGAWAEDRAQQIKVLSSESHKIERPVTTPPDCNWKDLSAYCYSSSPLTYVAITMVVEQLDGKSLRIECTAKSPSSRCVPLPVSQTFEARRRKDGLEIQYRDRQGRSRKQLYRIVSEN